MINVRVSYQIGTQTAYKIDQYKLPGSWKCEIIYYESQITSCAIFSQLTSEVLPFWMT